MLRSASAIIMIAGGGCLNGIARAETPAPGSFTYQASLTDRGLLLNDTLDFRFSLWDAPGTGNPPIGGSQIGSTVVSNGVQVVDGIFTVQLNTAGEFGTDAFAGRARWLQVQMDPSGGGGFVTLSPRHPITPAPYALGLRPGSRIEVQGPNGPTPGVRVRNSVSASGVANPVAVHGHAEQNNGPLAAAPDLPTGVHGSSVTGYGLYGESTGPAGVFGTTSSVSGKGVEGRADGATAAGVYGINQHGHGVWGRSVATGYGVYGEAPYAGGRGVFGTVTQSGSYGVYGAASQTSSYGVYGESNPATSTGVCGSSISGRGVWGKSTNNYGVYGETDAVESAGVYGRGPNSGVYGVTDGGPESAGIRGDDGGIVGAFAGIFEGNVDIEGTLSKSAGSFKIDHPLDPANKFLYHSFVESPDMKNVYDGMVTTGATGNATVQLPAYFQALNRDFRYQLTVIGQFAQAIVSREIDDNKFDIKTDKPYVKVSWQVTGIRHDPYAEAHRIPVEQEKSAVERQRSISAGE